MRLQTLTLLSTISSIHAAALPSQDTTAPTIVYERPIENGAIRYLGTPSLIPSDWDWEAGWGSSSPISLTHSLTRRCGSNQVNCSGSNKADKTACQTLVKVLSENPSVPVPPGVTYISATQGTSECYTVSKSQVNSIMFGYLAPAASSILNKCLSGDSVSGWATDVNLNNVCTNQCLSNRASC